MNFYDMMELLWRWDCLEEVWISIFQKCLSEDGVTEFQSFVDVSIVQLGGQNKSFIKGIEVLHCCDICLMYSQHHFSEVSCSPLLVRDHESQAKLTHPAPGGLQLRGLGHPGFKYPRF